MKSRLPVIQLIFIIWTMVIILRLGYWQIVKAESLKEQADFQHQSVISLPASRGKIFASDTFPLVANTNSFLLFANPHQLPQNQSWVSQLLSLLPASSSAATRINNLDSSLSWVSLDKQVSPPVKQAIEALKISGLGFESQPIRQYPEGSPSAYISGFVGKNEQGDPQGYFGLEGYYDRLLTGRPGKIIQERDALNRPIVIGSFNRILPQDGSDLYTSIDRAVQYLAIQKLEAGLTKYQAASGTVTIMESSSGRVLAMVSLPGYDPSRFSLYDHELYKNPIISESYEPGSTFKTIVMSSALDAQVVTPDTICTTCDGPVSMAGYTIGSWNNKYYPNSTMTDVILHSDNVGMVFVSRKLGKTKMLDYIRKFGFGKLTGIDLQEESTPILRPDNEWYDIDWATAAFGQGIAVTRLQMVTAVNAIANRGKLVYPRVVSGISTKGVYKSLALPAPVSVISPLAATRMTEMMINGVEKGEVRYYKPAGFLIAGKTGTAQVPISGHYDETKVIASFIGFAPADNPKFTMLVTLREPKSSPWGSTTAAPLWFDIARELFRYYRIPPKN